MAWNVFITPSTAPSIFAAFSCTRRSSSEIA